VRPMDKSLVQLEGIGLRRPIVAPQPLMEH
jgi:hypothetical protein